MWLPFLTSSPYAGTGCFVLGISIFGWPIVIGFITGAIGIGMDKSPKLAVLGCIIILAGCIFLGILSGKFNMSNCN